jgi:hypothetical protein
LFTFSEAFSAWSSNRTDDLHWGAWPNEDINANWGLHCGIAALDDLSTVISIERQVKISDFRSRWIVILPPGELVTPPRTFTKIVDILPPSIYPNVGCPKALISPHLFMCSIYVIENEEASRCLPVRWNDFVEALNNLSIRFQFSLVFGNYNPRPPDPRPLVHARCGFDPCDDAYKQVPLFNIPSPEYWRESSNLHHPYDEHDHLFYHPSIVWSGAYLFWRGGSQGVMRQVRPFISSNEEALTLMANFVSQRTRTYYALSH